MIRSGTALLALVQGAGALAQGAAAGAEEQPALPEIVVTADRRGFGAEFVQVGTFRNARIIDVPLTVNVVPQELLRAQAVTGLYDALRNTAGVSRSQLSGATYDNIAIRGILVENRTSYRLNGSLPVVNLVDLPLENKDRVEVLKGVGALYYGFAPPSGIINMVTSRADRDLIRVTASASEHGALSIHGDVSRRFSDAFGLRVNAAAGRVETGIDRFSGERYVLTGAADWRIADNLTFRFDVEHVTKDVTEPAAIALLPAVAGAITLPPVPDAETNLGGENLRYDASATNVLGRLNWRISDAWALTLEGGQALTVRNRDYSQLEGYNLATGNGTLRIFQTADQRYRNRNARLELAGAFATGPIEHNLIVGATSNWRFQNGRANRITTQAQNLFTPRNVVVTPVDPEGLTTAPLNIRDQGVYVFNRASIGPVQLLGGLRYTDYRSRSQNAAGVVTRFELDAWTPSVGLIFKPSRDVTFYATYLEGLEEGGTAPANTVNAFEVLPPAVSEQYELGAKAEVLRGLVLQAAAFQVSRPSAFTDPTDNRFKLAGEARYQGVELSATGEVTRRFSLYASLQYLDAEIRRAVTPALQGRTPENTPTWTASLFGEFRPAFAEGLALGAGIFHVGERAVNNFNQAFIPAYTTLSASIRYDLDRVLPGASIQLNADNLANERYYSAAGNGLLGVGLPRQLRLTLRTQF